MPKDSDKNTKLPTYNPPEMPPLREHLKMKQILGWVMEAEDEEVEMAHLILLKSNIDKRLSRLRKMLEQ